MESNTQNTSTEGGTNNRAELVASMHKFADALAAAAHSKPFILDLSRRLHKEKPRDLGAPLVYDGQE